MMDQKFYEEDCKILRTERDHWKQMYENVFSNYKETVESFDKIVMEMVKEMYKEKKVTEKDVERIENLLKKLLKKVGSEKK